MEINVWKNALVYINNIIKERIKLQTIPYIALNMNAYSVNIQGHTSSAF
jgi:uncharacterized membrane protein YbjE (DUF340 family)